MEIVQCIAHVDNLVKQHSERGLLCVDLPIAQWSNGDIVRIAGRFQSRGWTNAVFNPSGSQIRWKTVGRDKGLFAKGIVDVREPNLHLPIVR